MACSAGAGLRLIRSRYQRMLKIKPSNGNENTIEDLEKKVDENTQKFNAIIKKMIGHDYTMI